jgi:putative ABC transport system permease protein
VYLPYVFKELVKRKGRSITNLLAVTVLVALPIILTSIINGYTTAVYLPFQDVGADMIVQKSVTSADAPTGSLRLPFGRGLFPANQVSAVAAVPHVAAVSPALALWQFDNGKFISIEGIEPTSFVGTRLKAGIATGRFLESDDRDKVVLEKHFAKFYSLKVGNNLKVGDATFEVIGTVAVAGESQVSAQNIYMNLADTQRLLGTADYSQLYLRMDSLSSENAVRSQIARLDPQAVTTSANSIATSLSNAVSIYQRFQVLGAAILALIVAFILFQVSVTGLLERRREVGVMQTVGWTGKNVSRQVIAEVVLSTLGGCIVGLGASAAAVSAVGSVSVQANLPGSLSNDLTTLSAPLALSLTSAVEFSVFALVVSLVVSLFVVRRLFGMKPLANIRN